MLYFEPALLRGVEPESDKGLNRAAVKRQSYVPYSHGTPIKDSAEPSARTTFSAVNALTGVFFQPIANPRHIHTEARRKPLTSAAERDV